MNAILDRKNLGLFADKVHQQGARLVLTNGCFDLLHVGHVRYLQAAKGLGDILLVAINSDPSVRLLKGDKRPINSQNDRAEILASLRCVDYVTIFDSLRVAPVIRDVRPTLYVKGGDYTLETLNPEELAVLREIKTEIKFLPHFSGHSTTLLIKNCASGIPGNSGI